MDTGTAVVIGAGPAGLTAAHQLLQHTNIKPIVLEMTGEIGGISRTVNYKGNRIDIGGHRFFSKSDRIMDYWTNILPLQGKPARDDLILGRELPFSPESSSPDPEQTDNIMLIRNRTSRIFFMRNFFDYPLSLNIKTLKNLGLTRTFRIGMSYMKACLTGKLPERTLEDFLINRFGKELYTTFFRDYTEKVWGVPCTKIPAQWGAQRIKGLSVKRAVLHALHNIFRKDMSIYQKNTETTLIRQFLYPKLGPGQMWKKLASVIRSKGGEVQLNCQVVGLKENRGRITEVLTRNKRNKESAAYAPEYVISSMPIRDMVEGFRGKLPEKVRNVAGGLIYRDFITVGLLLHELKIKNETKSKTIGNIIPDNWIYIQEQDVKVGRLQIFNNWSPYMVKNPKHVWIGLEFFCNEGDDFWNRTDEQIAKLAVEELAKIDIIEKSKVLDNCVIRTPKAYPAYFGTYNRFDMLRTSLDKIENLFLVGRNGMHRYNNQDHSMLSAMAAVDNIKKGRISKDNIWSINTEEQYHESK